MEAQSRGIGNRLIRALGVLTESAPGRGALAVSAAASFLSARSPGAALVFVLLPAYVVLTRGDFSTAAGPEAGAAGGSPAAEIPSPSEIPLRLAAAALAAVAGILALGIGGTIAQRFRTQVFTLPWGLGAACAAASLILAAVHLPFLAAFGRRAGRIAAGTVFAATGIAAALSSFPVGSLYAAFLWLLYSGSAPALYLPLVLGAAVLASLSAAASRAILRARSAGR